MWSPEFYFASCELQNILSTKWIITPKYERFAIDVQPSTVNEILESSLGRISNIIFSIFAVKFRTLFFKGTLIFGLRYWNSSCVPESGKEENGKYFFLFN